MWMASYTQDEIAEAVNMPRQTLTDRLKVLPNLENLPKSAKLSALYQDDFEVPIYNIWTFNKKTNDVSHPPRLANPVFHRLEMLDSLDSHDSHDSLSSQSSLFMSCLKT